MPRSLLNSRFLRTAATGGDVPAVGGGGGASTPPATPAPSPMPPAPATPPATPPAATPGAGLPDDAVALKAEILRLRGENASDRVSAKQTAADEARKQLTQELAKALGIVEDDKLDPAKLTEQLTAAQTSQVEAARELSVFKASAAAGADASRLLDSRSFLTSIKDIPPTDTAAITKAIGEALTTNPTFKSVQAAGASGVDHAGGSGEGQRSKTPLPMAEAVARSMASQH